MAIDRGSMLSRMRVLGCNLEGHCDCEHGGKSISVSTDSIDFVLPVWMVNEVILRGALRLFESSGMGEVGPPEWVCSPTRVILDI